VLLVHNGAVRAEKIHFSDKKARFLQFVEESAVEVRLVDGLRSLQLIRQVDAVVLADIPHGSGRQEFGFGADTHFLQDLPATLQIAAEGVAVYPSEGAEGFLTDESCVVVNVNHRMM